MSVGHEDFWAYWRSFCHRLEHLKGEPHGLILEMMREQFRTPFMADAYLRKEAWQYAADLWKVGVSSSDLALLCQLGEFCASVADSIYAQAVDSGDWDYYYTNCGTEDFESVDEEEGTESLQILAGGYWREAKVREKCASVLVALQRELGLEYVPPEESLYAIYEECFLLGREDGWRFDFSTVVFEVEGRVWAPGWKKSKNANNLTTELSIGWEKRLGWSG